MLTNCKNCGAPLRRGLCEYCGTDYGEPWIQIDYKKSLNTPVMAMSTATCVGSASWNYYINRYKDEKGKIQVGLI